MLHGAIKKIIVACFYGPRYIESNTVFNSSLASSENKEYLIAVCKHWHKSCKEFLSDNFAENRMTLDVRLQNYGAINFVRFLDYPVCTMIFSLLLLRFFLSVLFIVYCYRWIEYYH